MQSKTNIRKPVEHNVLAKRPRVPAEGEPKGAYVSLLDVSLKGMKGTRVIQEDGRLRVLAEIGENGIHRQRRYDRVPVIRLSAKEIDTELAAR